MVKTPKISVSNNQLALILTAWAVFTQVRDIISAWALRHARQDATEEKVKVLDSQISGINDSLKSQMERWQSLQSDLEKTKGDLRAEVNRSYESDQGIRSVVDYIKQKVDDKKVP